MESSALYLRVFSSWQIIAVCLMLMFLLPLVFYIASTKSRRKPPSRAPRKRPAREKREPVPQPAAEDAEPDEGPEARARERAKPLE